MKFANLLLYQHNYVAGRKREGQNTLAANDMHQNTHLLFCWIANSEINEQPPSHPETSTSSVRYVLEKLQR